MTTRPRSQPKSASPPPSSEPPPSTGGEDRESVLSLFLRGVFWSVLAGLLLITFSPYQLSQLRVRLPWETHGRAGPVVYIPTPATQGSLQVGVVAGHWGLDSGAVCPNGLTEQQVNYEIARRVQQRLEAAGVAVDLLQEKDPRLQQYRANALISIHADVCVWPAERGQPPSGFKLAFASAVPKRVAIQAAQLKRCLERRYSAVTGLVFHPSSITRDMTEYHAFDEIDPATPAVIIETGFLANEQDYDLLVNHPDQVAEGIAAGILCYLRNEPLVLPTPTAAAEGTPNP